MNTYNILTLSRKSHPLFVASRINWCIIDYSQWHGSKIKLPPVEVPLIIWSPDV